MEKEEEKKVSSDPVDSVLANEETEALEIVLFQISECYVYLIPPRKSAASYRADEWNVNKWAWEGSLRVVSKGEECIIKLEDKSTGELYARAFLRKGEIHPVEPVIDSSRWSSLHTEIFRIFCSSDRREYRYLGGRLRHAFIGIGFRERTQAYDFQAALHDHIKYLDKKKTAEEMEQQFQKTSSVDYSLKDGETLHLQLKNKSSGKVKSKFFEQGMNNISLEDNCKEPVTCIKPLPPPPAPPSPAIAAQKTPLDLPQHLSPEGSAKYESPKSTKEDSKEQRSLENQSNQDIQDDDFGDFQAAG